MIYLVGISLSFFLSFLLFTKKGKITADKILACWLFSIGMHLLLYYMFVSGLGYQYTFVLGMAIPLPLIHGPFLYLYTASLTRQLTRNKTMVIMHFIPVVVTYLYLITFFVLPAEQKIFIYQHNGIGFEQFQKIHLVALTISGIFYVTWSSVLLDRHRHAILNQFSYTDKINLQWLQYLIYGIGIIWLLIFTSDKMVFSAAVVFVIFIAYFGIKQVGVFTNIRFIDDLSPPPDIPPGENVQNDSFTPAFNTGESVINEEKISLPVDIQDEVAVLTGDNNSEEKKKYSKSGLNAEMADSLHEKLNKIMAEQKLYRNSELSLTELADELGTLPNYLSQVINEREMKNFYDYINALRIDEFKKKISNPVNQKFTLLALAFDCGFNSKSSFNKNFKKITGHSPSEYLQHLHMTFE